VNVHVNEEITKLHGQQTSVRLKIACRCLWLKLRPNSLGSKSFSHRAGLS
jgi:hypothetical protein